MKSRLEQVHSELLAAIDELEALTAEALPDVNRISAVRWKLSKASGRRFRFLETDVYPQIRFVGGDLAKRLQQLRDEGAEIRAKSTGHVGSWAISEVLKNWAGYCQASSEMRQAMRLRIEREREVVGLLADAVENNGGSASVMLNAKCPSDALQSYVPGG